MVNSLVQSTIDHVSVTDYIRVMFQYRRMSCSDVSTATAASTRTAPPTTPTTLKPDDLPRFVSKDSLRFVMNISP
jgi:hypothetical protein